MSDLSSPENLYNWRLSFQPSICTYGSVTFQSSVKFVMEIYGSVSEAGEFGLKEGSIDKAMKKKLVRNS